MSQYRIGQPTDAFSLLNRDKEDTAREFLESIDPANPIFQVLSGQAPLSTVQTRGTVNAVMNGSFQIWQRGTTFTSPSISKRLADRWLYMTQVTGARHTVTRETDIPEMTTGTGQRNGSGLRYSMLSTLTTGDASVGASDIVWLKHPIENPDTFFKFTKQNLTLSFWVKATKVGTYSVVLGDTTAFGDAAGQGLSYITSYNVNVTNTWERKVIVIPANTTSWPAGSPISLGFVLMAGTSYHATANVWADQSQKYAVAGQVNGCNDTTSCLSFYIAGVQLETGTVASPFQHIDFTTELLSCMRFYEKSFQYATTPAYGVSWTLGRPAIGVQVVGASTLQNLAVTADFRVPKRVSASGSNTIFYNPVTASDAQVRNITAAADCTSTAMQSASQDAVTFHAVTPAGSAAGELLALHWAIDVEIV